MVPAGAALNPASRRAAARAPGGEGNALAALCFVLSGAAGLIYEVCWIRRASLVFGSTLYATSTVLAVFFLGLSIGSWVFGGVAARSPRPLRVVAGLELALAAIALLTLPAFGFAEELYGHVFRSLAGHPAPLRAARFALVGAVLLPPAFLMGGTLPLLCRQFARRAGRLAQDAGFLYGINTLGAAAGCALAGFVLIPSLGLARGVMTGAALSAISGLVLGSMNRSAPEVETVLPAGGREFGTERPWTAGAVLFLVGFATLGLEVLWTRFLSLVLRQTVTTYTLALSVVLTGIVLGSLLAARIADRSRTPAWLLGLLPVSSGLLTLALLLRPPSFWQGFGSEIGVAFALLLVPAVLSGATFPLAVRLAVREPSDVPRAVGRLTAINTAGGIAGSLVTGFALLPGLGMQLSLRMLTAASLAAGAVAWLGLGPTGSRRGRLAMGGSAVGLWLLIPALSGTRLPADFLAPREELVSWREGLQSNLAVVRREGRLQLEIDRWWQGQDTRTHQIVAAHLPMLLHPSPRTVLVVGAGAGQTPARFLMHDPERLDVVDIEPAVFDLIRAHFDAAWMSDPRVHLIRDDGRDLVAHSSGRWDVISLEVGQIFRPGVGAFYTREFYQDARAHLAPGGLVSQFVPLPFLTPDTFRRVIATFQGVFPECQLWFNTSELLLIGARDSLPQGWGRLGSAGDDPRVRADLEFAYWGGPRYALNQPAVLEAGFLCGPRGLAAIAAGAAVLSDDRPVLEYSTRGVDETQMREIPIAELLRAHLDALPPGSDPRTAQVRSLNLGDLDAGAHLRRAAAARARDDDQEVIGEAAAAAEGNPENLEAHRLLGDALLRTGRLPEAQSELRKVVLGDPSDGGARRALAVALQQAGDAAGAIRFYEEALRLSPGDAEAHNNLGAALASRGNLAGALVHFERALELRPGYVEARDNVRRVRLALGVPVAPAPVRP